MSYIGSTPTTQSFIEGTDYFNGDGSTTAFTLSRSVVSVNDIQATINNVVQQPNTAYTVSGTTITFTSAPSAGTANIYVRYLSTTTQSITPSQGTVSYSTMDSNMQAKQGISFKNRLINGDFKVNQYGSSSVTPTNAVYYIDRWKFFVSQSSKITAQQNAGSVTPPVGFTNYYGVTSSSSYSVGASDYFMFNQRIEGYNVADLGFGTANAKTVTLSFWVRSSLTGTFSGVLTNGANVYTYPFTYTINTANTWEQKSVTITGATSGTWATDNSSSFELYFSLGVGSSLSTTAGAWAANTYYAATGSVNLVGTSGATWYVTGVQLEVGTQATTFDYRDYGREFMLCQRYYWKTVNPHLSGLASNSSSANRLGASLPVTMRSNPTVTFSGTIQTYDGSTSQTITSAGSAYSTTNFFEIDATFATGSSATSRPLVAYIDATITGYFSISAEL